MGFLDYITRGAWSQMVSDWKKHLDDPHFHIRNNGDSYHLDVENFPKKGDSVCYQGFKSYGAALDYMRTLQQNPPTT